MEPMVRQGDATTAGGGHLCGRALREWSLLRMTEKESLVVAVSALCTRLVPGSRALVAQDFHHAAQREGESVADYISRLEQLFQELMVGRLCQMRRGRHCCIVSCRRTT